MSQLLFSSRKYTAIVQISKNISSISSKQRVSSLSGSIFRSSTGCIPSNRYIELNSLTAISNKRYASSSSNEFAEGDVIDLKNGSSATIKAKLNSGWWLCVETDAQGVSKEIKIRTSEIKNDPSTPRKISSQLFGSNQIMSNQLIADRVKNIQTVNSLSNESVDFSDVENLPINLPVIDAPSRHVNTYKWIIFSDIHVKSSSIDTCERVLDMVHEAAVKRNAGIIFLGDFWHVRGALSVDLLTRVMKSLKDWTQPVILIPGNHDQVTLGGMVHSIEPLSYSFSRENALLISEPSLCLGALWLPYRRNYQYLQRILQDPVVTSSNAESQVRQAGSSGSKPLPAVSMIFCHADVRGAFMNDGARCDSGLELSDFPGGIPVYSGHFHKPHTMKIGNSRLRYVGSPYQTSLSEAGQAKYLYCMGSIPSQNEIFSGGDPNVDKLINQRRQWYEEERWEIDVGRKYFKLSSIHDPKLSLVKAGDRAIIPVSFIFLLKRCFILIL